MFILPDGRPISPDVAFSLNGISYPANWLRLASPAEREAIGITEQPDPAPYDQRFYWGYDADGKLIPKDHAQLVDQWVAQTKQIAASLLAPYDWYITRKAENDKPVPQEVLDYRGAIRTQSDNREALIKGTSSTDELVVVITEDFGGLLPWPNDPFAPQVDEPVGDTEV